MNTLHNRKLMKLWAILLLLLFMVSGCGAAEPEKDGYTVGILSLGQSLEPVVNGFKEGMTERGYVEGENITYVYSGPATSEDQLPAKLQEVMESPVDLLLTLSIPPTVLAQQATEGSDIPIVFAPINDPVATGIVQSLTDPGGNITGIKAGGFLPKELEWLLQISPNTERVFLPTNPTSQGAMQGLQQLQSAAAQLNVEIVVAEFTTEEMLLDLLNNIPDDVDAVMMITDSLILSHASDFIRAANGRQLPLASISLAQVQAGALFSFGPEFFPMGKQAARLVDQVLQGTAAGDLPIETAEFLLNINQKTAQTIGLQIPDNVLRQADTVIRE